MQSTVQFVLRPKFQAVHQNRSVIFCQSFSKWHHTEEKNVNVIFFADCWSVMTTAVWYFVSRDLVSLFVDRQQAAQHFEKLLTIRFRAHNVRIIHILRTSYTYDTSHSQPKYSQITLAPYFFTHQNIESQKLFCDHIILACICWHPKRFRNCIHAAKMEYHFTRLTQFAILSWYKSWNYIQLCSTN